jgi:hypothetical protein
MSKNVEEFLKLLETNLTCTLCHKQVEDPLLSKCQKRSCKKCFKEMLEKNKNSCLLCNQKEDLTESIVDKQGENIKTLQKSLKSYIKELDDAYKTYDTKCILYLDKHFENMVNEIDIFTEKSIHDHNKTQLMMIKADQTADQTAVDGFNKIRDENLKKIKAYKDECINGRDDGAFGKFFNSLKVRFNILQEKTKDWSIKLSQSQLDAVLKEIRELKVRFLEDKEGFEKKLFHDKFYFYDIRTNELKILYKHITEQDRIVAK